MIEFTAGEILTIAVQIERNGRRFYTRAAQTAETDSAKDLFNGLAVLEQSHEETFSAMRRDLPEREKTAVTFDPDDQTGAYLQALADNRVFDVQSDPVQKLTGRESPQDVIKLALGMEKDSIVFYLGMREIVSPPLGRDKVDAIIREEMRHITVLSKELASL